MKGDSGIQHGVFLGFPFKGMVVASAAILLMIEVTQYLFSMVC